MPLTFGGAKALLDVSGGAARCRARHLESLLRRHIVGALAFRIPSDWVDRSTPGAGFTLGLAVRRTYDADSKPNLRDREYLRRVGTARHTRRL